MFLTKTLMSCHVWGCHVLHAQLSKCNALHRAQCIWFTCLGCRQTHLDFENNNGVQLRWSKRGWKITLNRDWGATGAAVKEVSHCFEIVSPSFSFKTKDQRNKDQTTKDKNKGVLPIRLDLKVPAGADVVLGEIKMDRSDTWRSLALLFNQLSKRQRTSNQLDFLTAAACSVETRQRGNRYITLPTAESLSIFMA